MRTILALSVCVLLSTGAFAAKKVGVSPACQRPVAMAIEQGQALAQREGAKFSIISHDDTQKVMDFINKEPPVSNIKADKLLVIEMPEDGPTFVGIILNDCFGKVVPFKGGEWRAMITEIFGADS